MACARDARDGLCKSARNVARAAARRARLEAARMVADVGARRDLCKALLLCGVGKLGRRRQGPHVMSKTRMALKYGATPHQSSEEFLKCLLSSGKSSSKMVDFRGHIWAGPFLGCSPRDGPACQISGCYVTLVCIWGNMT